MPLDPATLIARTTAGDAELSAPRHGLAIAQRRLLQLLDQPLGLDELAGRPGIQPDRLERDLAKLAEIGLVQVHRPAGSTGPMFPSRHRPAAGRDILPPPTPTVTGNSKPMLRVPAPPGSPGPPVVGRRVRRGRALVVGFASLVAVGLGILYFAAPTAQTPRPESRPPARPTASPPPARVPPASVSSTPAKPVEPVRVLLAADPPRPATAAPSPEPAVTLVDPPVVRSATPSTEPAPALTFVPVPAVEPPAAPPAPPERAAAPPVRAAAPPPAPPLQLAVAAPPVQETRIAPLKLTPVSRELPDFPREAFNAGVTHGTVKARLTVDAAGRVSHVDIVEAEPRRVFDRAVTRTLARWTFEPGAADRTTDVEIAFRRE